MSTSLTAACWGSKFYVNIDKITNNLPYFKHVFLDIYIMKDWTRLQKLQTGSSINNTVLPTKVYSINLLLRHLYA
jgi:hypothetical protein